MAQGTESARGALTSRQRFWLEHLRSAEAQGVALKAYAHSHDLSVCALYAAKSDLKKRGALGASTLPIAPPKLVPVRITRAASSVRVFLPNGVVVEVPEYTDADSCRTLLTCAHALA